MRLRGAKEVLAAQGMIRCSYCNEPAKLVTGAEVYPDRPELAEKQLYRCDPCSAHVGVDKFGKPFGSLAKQPLRALRVYAHKAVDPIWKLGFMNRKEMYAWLSFELLIPFKFMHIGSMKENQCRQIIQLGKQYLKENINEENIKLLKEI